MIWNTILLALRALRRNVLRSVLTMLGIIIGVSSVIILVTLGKGTTQLVTDQIASLGSNMLMVNPGKRMGPVSTGASPFKVTDADALRLEVPSLAGVSPSAARSVTAIYGSENWASTATGSNEEYFKVNNRKLADGRLFNSTESRQGAAVCVIGETVRSKLFGLADPVGSKIRVGKISCEVIGLMAAKGQSTMGTDQDDLIVIPLRTFQRRVAGSDEVALIQVSFKEGAVSEQVQRDIRRLMRVRRHLSGGEEDDFTVMDMKEIANMLSGTTIMMTALLSTVAAVSLLVGGIGIMNILLVSVTERTREIGIRLAIGALERDVLLQFLVEAVVLSSFGGIIGIVLALVVSILLAGLLSIPLILNAPIIIGAFLFSAGVGVVFGFFPARKAAQLDPIEALRHE